MVEEEYISHLPSKLEDRPYVVRCLPLSTRWHQCNHAQTTSVQGKRLRPRHHNKDSIF